MEYVQERVRTLHAFDDPAPEAPTDRAAVVVPMTECDHASLAAERVLTALESVGPSEVVVALRAAPDRVLAVESWLDGFDLPVTTVWCDGPGLEELLSEHGLDGSRGKGRDVWLALGVAAERADYVAVHDSDARSYTAALVPRLLFPLAHGSSFSKGYYARVENGRLYGRLCRLFYEPLVAALAERHAAPVLDYLGAFRYALAGEFATTSDIARRLRVQRGWGLEVGSLGEAFRLAGIEGSAQVDLGIHEHDHRAVSGPSGLSTMAAEVGGALFRVVEEGGVSPDYASLPADYLETAKRFVRGYEADAAFNGLAYDRGDELEQVRRYVDAVRAPGEDSRLPAWVDAPVTPGDVLKSVRADLERVTR